MPSREQTTLVLNQLHIAIDCVDSSLKFTSVAHSWVIVLLENFNANINNVDVNILDLHNS